MSFTDNGKEVNSTGSLKSIPLKSKVETVQPMTGIVLWTTNPAAESAPIQLEYTYLKYDHIVVEKGMYDWTSLETILEEVATRKHQAILRWHDTYVARPTGVPKYIKRLEDYKETNALSEGKPTGFPDWSNNEWKRFVLEFFAKFAERYDNDPRIAFVQVGFGLWAEYHIYDGPMQPGLTFPDKEFQTEFFKHLSTVLVHTPWMISVDAAGGHTPFADSNELLNLKFGVFDDSFNHRRHKQYNEPNWNHMGRDRWKTSPTGGEFSFFETKDQKQALAAKGPYGITFEKHAEDFHISFMIGDNQPKYQSHERICKAGMACGYRFRITKFLASSTKKYVEIANTGIAPMYHDAYPKMNGMRSQLSLKGLLPGDSRMFEFICSSCSNDLTITSDRLVEGQWIGFDADLS